MINQFKEVEGRIPTDEELKEINLFIENRQKNFKDVQETWLVPRLIFIIHG